MLVICISVGKFTKLLVNINVVHMNTQVSLSIKSRIVYSDIVVNEKPAVSHIQGFSLI